MAHIVRFDKFEERSTGSGYTGAKNLSECFENCRRNQYPFKTNNKCHATIKIDGTQLWLRFVILDDGSLKLLFIKSHGGNTQGEKISPDGWNTPQSVFESNLTFQGGNIYRTIGDPNFWDAIQTVMRELGIKQMDVYCEHTFAPDKKTPCGLDYRTHSPEIFDRLFIFEFVWFDSDNIKYSITHTTDFQCLPWAKVILPWMIPIVESLSNRPLSIELLQDIFRWLETYSFHEGLMLKNGQTITKIKLHHAKDLLPNMEDFEGWIPDESLLELKDFVRKLYHVYTETLAKNNIHLKKASQIFQKKEKTPKQQPNSNDINYITFDEPKVIEEINKALSHENWTHLLESVRQLGQPKSVQTQNKFYKIVGTTKIKNHDGSEVNLSELVCLGLLDEYNRLIVDDSSPKMTMANFSKTYKNQLNEVLHRTIKQHVFNV